MSVVKPWIVLLPAPETSHVLCGVPGRQFSATIAFAGLAQSAAAMDGEAAKSTPTERSMASRSARFVKGSFPSPDRTPDTTGGGPRQLARRGMAFVGNLAVPSRTVSRRWSGDRTVALRAQHDRGR